MPMRPNDMRPRFLTGFMKSYHTYFAENYKVSLEYYAFPEYSFRYRIAG